MPDMDERIHSLLLARAELARHICDAGERPLGQHQLSGKVRLRRTDSLVRVSWFVVEEDYLWHCMSNGGSHADGQINNVLATEAGAAGHRVKRTPELDAQLGALVEGAKELIHLVHV
jgi:hypothetical protein